MKILVTGGAGFIGSHTCKALNRAGYQPVVYDNLSTGHPDAVKWGVLEHGDIRDLERLQTAIATHKPEAVMHFAALAYVGESVIKPAKYYDVNVRGTLTLLEAMRAAGLKTIVFSSTCATYGIPERFPITEDMPQRPINPYGFTKLAIERALADYGAAYGLRWASLRYFNAAGCDPDGELGERHDPETHAIPLAIQAALGAGPRFQVMGSDYPTKDGSAVRDYIHVGDLADAHVRAVDYLRGGGEPQAFNLGTGAGVSVLDMLRAVSAATGRSVPFDLGPRRAGDPPELYASPDKARRLLGWEPRWTDIEATVATAARWFMRRHNAASG